VTAVAEVVPWLAARLLRLGTRAVGRGADVAARAMADCGDDVAGRRGG
jgi:hypothetical protein